uniref:hypothetical protein n=1 Tax=Hydrogenimonas sp. TaxID=2231112 RepID=UPI00260C7BC8
HILERLYEANPDRWAQDYIKNLNRLSYLYNQTGRFEEASSLNRRSRMILSPLYRDDPASLHLDHIRLLNNLAHTHLLQKSISEAKEEALACLAELETVENDPPTYFLKEILTNLVAIFEATGMEREAQRCGEWLDSITEK